MQIQHRTTFDLALCTIRFCLLAVVLQALVLLMGCGGGSMSGGSNSPPPGNTTVPLVISSNNSHYFVNSSGKAVLLSGSHTWNDFQDLNQVGAPQTQFDFAGFVNFLSSHGHDVTILWRWDLPTFCGWEVTNFGNWTATPFPWKRTGPGTASDGQPRFDLTQLDSSFFDRLRTRVSQLQQNGIYVIVMLFDGGGLNVYRCSNDGYPFTGQNNINGIDDGYPGNGSAWANSMTMSAPNAITNIQDVYVKKAIDTLHDLDNVLWEISEEAPDNSTWWQGHIIDLIHTYERQTYGINHPVGFPSLSETAASDSTLYNSNADWVAPMARISPTSSCGTGTPACKVNINDSDHSYFGMWNDSAQVNRNYIWENFTSGSQALFMDPYFIYWPGTTNNVCTNPTNGVCSRVDPRWDNFRENLHYTLNYANKMNLLSMTPQPGLASTGWCLANASASGEYLVYVPNGGSFTVDLSAKAGNINVEWFDPSSGTTSAAGTVTGGAVISFTSPFGSDAVLYLK